MTDATATFHDVTVFDGRTLALGECRRILRFFVRGACIGLGGVAAACVAMSAVIALAVWIVSASLVTNSHLHAKGSIGPVAIGLVGQDMASANAADITGSIPRSYSAGSLTFEIKWARTMAMGFASFASAYDGARRDVADVPESPRVAVLTPVALPEAAPTAPGPIERDLDQRSIPPLPRPNPAKRNLASVPAEQATVQAAPQVAAIAPPPASLLKKSDPQPRVQDKPEPPPEPPGRTAVYDIAAATVFMPNGDRLEAHSGLGDRQDDPRYIKVKNRGPTPPNVYRLTLRERLFHGVRAVRLNPVDEGKMFGRDGMLAHTYMLGPSGQSNGCVSFKDYQKFLRAFLRGEVDRLVVVASLGNTSWRVAAAGGRVPARRYADNREYDSQNAIAW